ncbi:phosphoribosyltransferase [Nitrosopumilus sp. b3]|uniref:phosphoribosyltransferase n=1 Tax=Nitrosopumilus sp. b3 TaxID=2109909 RepID=UPI0015F522E8|nr:phosphoribosyltransferase [Nitrosopumilus sp. b3]KAF6247805.1 phosphoribosyltransferase [Nitrosopumilus sp. b3]
MVTSQNVDWDEIESMVKTLSKTISKLPRTFTSISTVSRGGLIPSRLLADHLGIEKILVDKKKISSDSLFVDDIYDTGETFNKIISMIDEPSKLVFVTLFARRGKKYPEQLIYATKTKNSAYVVFPWDKLEFKRDTH